VSVSNVWLFPKVGDLVYHTDDKKKGITCVGVVLGIRSEARDKIKTNVRVLWASEGVSDSWHRAYKLEVINESR